MNKKEIARVLKEIGIILDIKGENPFKTRAYYNGARIIEMMEEDLNDLVGSGEIANIKGIGQALSEKIKTMVNTGSLPFYDELKASIPEGLLEIIKLPGLGAKKVKALHDQLDIKSIGELEYACRENRLRDLPGFGQKSQENILRNIEMQKKYKERYLYPVALNAAELLLEYLRGNPKIKDLEIAGSLRRKMETIKDIDLIGSCPAADRENIMEYFTGFQDRISIISHGETKSAIILSSGITAELRLVNETEFPFLLQYNTGNKDHNTELRRLAKQRGLKLNEYGLFRGDKSLECQNEGEIYRNLGLVYIDPELREGMGELEAISGGQIPVLFDGEPFHGILHIHSIYSDGANTIQQLADACKTAGMSYMGISDHSKSAVYANGLTEERIRKQLEEIDQINKSNPDFTIFKGIEVDILPDGKLDYNDDILSLFDFTIASVHSHFNLSEEQQTRRICKALKNRYVTFLGHPSGRLLLAREGYAVKMEEIISVAAGEGKAIEINASPYRLDLDWRWVRKAKKRRIKMALNPDAHSIEGLWDYQYGIGIARKGGLEKEDVLNSYTSEELYNYFQIR